MGNPRTAVLGALAVLASVLGGPASAAPRTVSDSYDVSGAPAGPALFYADTVACGASQEGVHKSTRTLQVPFSGWLRVELAEITGDWDVAVANATGDALAWGATQGLGGTGDVERLDYYVTRGSDLRIVACNYAGGPTGKVTYRLVEGPTGVKPQPKYRELTVELPYESPAAGVQGRWALCYVGFGVGCAAIEPPAWARFVQVSVEDLVSPAVAAKLYTYAGDTGHGDRDFCSAIDEPVALQPRTDWVGTVVLNGPCLDGTPAQATRGTVTLVFTTHPVPRG